MNHQQKTLLRIVTKAYRRHIILAGLGILATGFLLGRVTS